MRTSNDPGPFRQLEAQLIRHRIQKKSIAAWLGCGQTELSLILSGNRKPTPRQALNLVRLTKFLEARPSFDFFREIHLAEPNRKPATKEVRS